MKKKLALLLALVMVCATMLTACGKSSDIGGTTWELTKVEAPQGTFDADQIKENGMSLTFEFKKDGTVVNSTSEDAATWKQDGDKVSITADGETQEFTIDGDILKLEMNGMKLELTKK